MRDRQSDTSVRFLKLYCELPSAQKENQSNSVEARARRKIHRRMPSRRNRRASVVALAVAANPIKKIGKPNEAIVALPVKEKQRTMRVLRLTEITNRLGQLVIENEDRKGDFTCEEWHSTITLVFFFLCGSSNGTRSPHLYQSSRALVPLDPRLERCENMNDVMKESNRKEGKPNKPQRRCSSSSSKRKRRRESEAERSAGLVCLFRSLQKSSSVEHSLFPFSRFVLSLLSLFLFLYPPFPKQ